jgi:DnaJ-class molecular chaperone
MAGEQEDSVDQAEGSHGPQECMPCRGTGKVISNLGEKASKVACPWCDGQGTRQVGVDAQAHWLSVEDGADAAPADEAA